MHYNLNMNLEIITVRFGDPILSLSTNSSGFAFGTAFGMVFYKNLIIKEEIVISEVSDEPVKGIFLSKDQVLYYAVGDYYSVVASNMKNIIDAKTVSNELYHSHNSCPKFLVLMHKTYVLLVAGISHMPILYITNLENEEKLRFYLKGFVVPFDFDGKRLLGMFYQGDTRIYEVISLENEVKYQRILTKKSKNTQYTHFKLWNNKIMYVKNYSVLKI